MAFSATLPKFSRAAPEKTNIWIPSWAKSPPFEVFFTDGVQTEEDPVDSRESLHLFQQEHFKILENLV
jgi:hypothetical protein